MIIPNWVSPQPIFAGIHSAHAAYMPTMDVHLFDTLRGDYAAMTADWTVAQQIDRYSDDDQAVWRLLVERQTALARRHACREFLDGLATLGIGDSIPDFDAVNAKLEPLTAGASSACPVSSRTRCSTAIWRTAAFR